MELAVLVILPEEILRAIWVAVAVAVQLEVAEIPLTIKLKLLRVQADVSARQKLRVIMGLPLVLARVGRRAVRLGGLAVAPQLHRQVLFPVAVGEEKHQGMVMEQTVPKVKSSLSGGMSRK
jgi:hypothetical protein